MDAGEKRRTTTAILEEQLHIAQQKGIELGVQNSTLQATMEAEAQKVAEAETKIKTHSLKVKRLQLAQQLAALEAEEKREAQQLAAAKTEEETAAVKEESTKKRERAAQQEIKVILVSADDVRICDSSGLKIDAERRTCMLELAVIPLWTPSLNLLPLL